MRKSFIIALIVMLALPVFAGRKGREVRQYEKGASRMGATIYALPKVYVQIEIKALCTISKPGPFAQYAERYLANNTAIQNESRVWSFVSADVKEKHMVDSTKMYMITGETEEIVFDKGTIFLKSVGNWEKKREHPKCDKGGGKEVIDTVFHTELLGEEALTSTSIPKMAERAAKQIFMLREARMSILTCDVNHQPDGAATKEILERIDRDERELTALFVGKRVTISKSRFFNINPAESKNNIIIARMSTIEGITAAEDMIGTPIYVSTKVKTVPAPQETKKERKAVKGYFYNVPGTVRIAIRHGEEYTVTRTIDVPQNGYATWLAPSVSNIRFNKNGTIKKMR